MCACSSSAFDEIFIKIEWHSSLIQKEWIKFNKVSFFFSTYFALITDRKVSAAKLNGKMSKNGKEIRNGLAYLSGSYANMEAIKSYYWTFGFLEINFDSWTRIHA